MDLANDLELPGFPTKKSGIFSSIQTTIINTFSLKAVLRAMFGGIFMLFRNTSWHLSSTYNIINDCKDHYNNAYFRISSLNIIDASVAEDKGNKSGEINFSKSSRHCNLAQQQTATDKISALV